MSEAANTTIGTQEDLAARSISIGRHFAAPRRLVWEAWTVPEHLEQWWGPSGFRTSTLEYDLRPGGRWRHVMHGPDGTDYPNRTTFREVVEPERIVYVNGWDSDDAEPMFEATILFEEADGGTRLTMNSLFSSAELRQEVVEKYGAIEGGKQTLERLAEYLSTLS